VAKRTYLPLVCVTDHSLLLAPACMGGRTHVHVCTLQKIQWFDVAALPSPKDDDARTRKYWTVLPFVGYALCTQRECVCTCVCARVCVCVCVCMCMCLSRLSHVHWLRWMSGPQ
jgi:hypothetical protein